MTSLRSALTIATLLILAAVTAAALKPQARLADNAAHISLAAQVPTQFQGWREDQAANIALPDPDVQAQLRDAYSDTLDRTYVDAAEHRVMLSIAYGNDQSGEATQAHRPEYCYAAQGFLVKRLPQGEFFLDGQRLEVRRLVGVRGQRYEPISYWLTIDGQATLPGLRRKWLQLQYGFRRQIPDGMVVRVSTVGLADDKSFALQQTFLQALYEGMNATVRIRYFGEAKLQQLSAR